MPYAAGGRELGEFPSGREVWMPTPKLATRNGLVASLVILVGCSPGEVAQAQAQDRSRAQAEVREQLGGVPTTLDTTTAAALSGTFRAAADRALPALVYVRVEQERTVARGEGRPFPFFDFPGDSPQERLEVPREGHGSGFIIDDRGHILTNAHVVSEADRVMVRLLDGREFPAEVVGTDPGTDVAVLRIDPEGESLPVAQVGDSDRLRVGDWVLALGSPLGLDFTVTAGIVSAKNRSINILGRQSELPLEAFIQTDAAINPGNSGGPLVDLLGRVVGISSAIASPTGVYAGYGFAVPINLAMAVADDLLEYGVVHRPRLGVQIMPVTAVDAEVYGLDRITGAEVVAVTEGTPAAEAGIRPGDVVIAVDDTPVRNVSELQAVVARHDPGQRVTLTLVRYSERLEVPVELGEFELPAEPRRVRNAGPPDDELLGFSVAPLTPRLADRLDMEAADGAVVIEDVGRLHPAVPQGLRPGQVILRINGEQIGSVEDVERIAESLEPGDVVSLLVRDPERGDVIINYRTRQ